MTSSASKAELRAEALARRLRAAQDLPDAGARLVEIFTSHERAHGAEPVGGYWPLDGEINPRPLMEYLAAQGCALSLPAVAAPDAPLVFRAWRPGDRLVPGGHGVQEPDAAASVVEPRTLLLPLVAADVHGGRLGFGKGYYDRTLARLRATGPVKAIGLAFDEQVFDLIPTHAHDEHLDMLVTPTRLLRFSSSSASVRVEDSHDL